MEWSSEKKAQIASKLRSLSEKVAQKRKREESESDEESHYDKEGNLLPCYDGDNFIDDDLGTGEYLDANGENSLLKYVKNRKKRRERGSILHKAMNQHSSEDDDSNHDRHISKTIKRHTPPPPHSPPVIAIDTTFSSTTKVCISKNSFLQFIIICL